MSDVLVQQINLYRPAKVHEGTGLTFRKMLLLWFVVGMSVSLYTGFLFWQKHHKQVAFTSLSNQKAEIKSQLDEQLKVFSQAGSEEDLRKEINQLIEKRNEQTALIVILLEQGLEKTGGFSPFFKALSDTHVEGTWYTRILLKDDGDSMALQGRALKPDLVPEIFDSLDKSKILDGKSFDNVSIQSDAKEGYVLFDVSSKSVKK